MRTALPLVIAVAACTRAPITHDAGGGSHEQDALRAGEYCESIVDFFCAYYVRCGRMAVASVAECEPVFLEACNARYEPSYVSLANAGLLSLSRDGIAACQAHLDDVACGEQLLDLDGPCAGMWQGTQPAGAACGFDVESFVCAPGTACTLGLDFCGTCETVVADGDPCSDEGVTCARTSSCVDGVCTPRARIGDPCGDAFDCVLGARCVDGACAAPTYVGVGDPCGGAGGDRCPYASACIDGACVRSSELGGACGADASGAACDSGTCSDDGVCVELRAQGASCDAGAQCQTGACDDGTCLALPDACITDATDGG